MKYLYTIFIFSMLLVSGCSKNESLNELKQENKQLKQDNAKLFVKNEKLIVDQATTESNSKLSLENADKLNQEVRSLQAENENQVETITRYQKAFESLQSDSNILVNTFSIFSREHVKKGSRVAGLIVSNISKETTNGSTSYYVDFTGEFEVRGSIIHNETGGSKYSFIVNENLEKLPHSLNEFERNRVYFDIKSDKELIRMLGNKLENLSPSGQLQIEGVFKNYSYNYVPESDVSNTAEFVGLTSQN